MFSKVRWNIAVWFIGLSTAAYLIPTALALVLFYYGLTNAIDHELHVFLASFGHAIKEEEGMPELKDWTRDVETNPLRSLVSYQLFDRNKKLLEEHGPPGIPVFFDSTQQEVRRSHLCMRTRMTALEDDNEVIGYLQAQLPTTSRDEAVNELAIITSVVAPFVLLGLGWSSYLVSEKATVETRKTLMLLRQFVADAGHELYTPLSIVQAANDSMQKRVKAEGLPADELDVSQGALDRMEKMLEDLMLLSSIENPEDINLSKKALVSLGELVSNAASEFRAKFEKKNVALSSEIFADGSVYGDEISLTRMVANLLENALRYTDPGGEVNISVNRQGSMAQIKVADTGIGIPDESLPKIFDRFYRVDVSRSRESGGSGLGLSIAQAIAQSHGGSIAAHSKIGRGTTFTVTLSTANARSTRRKEDISKAS